MTRIDDRTPEQQVSLPYLVVARDIFLSDWGKASKGASWCAWAYDSLDNAETGKLWVEGRSDMRDVYIVNAKIVKLPRSCVHFHIYVAEANHPSLQNA